MFAGIFTQYPFDFKHHLLGQPLFCQRFGEVNISKSGFEFIHNKGVFGLKFDEINLKLPGKILHATKLKKAERNFR
jgi:hypothetical protein